MNLLIQSIIYFVLKNFIQKNNILFDFSSFLGYSSFGINVFRGVLERIFLENGGCTISLTSITSLQNLSLPNRQAGWFCPADGFRDQFLRKIPLFEILQSTDSFQWNLANAIPTVTFLARGATKTLPAQDVTLKSIAFTRVGQHFEIDTYDSVSGRMCDNLEIQARGLELGILRALSLQLIEGVATPNILGLRHLSLANTIGAANNAVNGGFMTLQDIYRAIYMVQATDDEIGGGAADYAVCNPKTLRELMGLIDATSRSEGLTWVFDEELCVEVPKFRGLKWLFSDSVPLNETKGLGTNLTSIYFIKMSGPNGLRLLYARDSRVKEVNRWGIHRSFIPVASTKNRRGMSIEGYYALLAFEPKVVSRLNGINPTQFAL